MGTVSILGCGWLGMHLGILLKEQRFIVKGSTTRKEKLVILQKTGIKPFLIHAGETLKGENLSDFFETDLLILNIPPGRRRPDVVSFHPQQVRSIIETALSYQLPKLLFISSTGIYGNTNQIVTEADLPIPQTESGKALLKVETYLKAIPDMKLSILRFSGLVGGDRKAGRFLAGRKGLKNGAAPVNMVHRDDCIQIIYQVIQQQRWGKIYNVSADEHPTKKMFYTSQALKHGLEAPEFQDESEISYKIISNKRLKKELDYLFLHPDPMRF